MSDLPSLSNIQSLPLHLHTSDYYQKTKALRGRETWSKRIWSLLFGAGLVLIGILAINS